MRGETHHYSCPQIEDGNDECLTQPCGSPDYVAAEVLLVRPLSSHTPITHVHTRIIIASHSFGDASPLSTGGGGGQEVRSTSRPLERWSDYLLVTRHVTYFITTHAPLCDDVTPTTRWVLTVRGGGCQRHTQSSGPWRLHIQGEVLGQHL